MSSNDKKKAEHIIKPKFSHNQIEWDNMEKNKLLKLKEKSDIITDETKNDSTEELPHQKSLEEIAFDVRKVFLKVLELVLDKKNPIPYIISENKNQFAFCVLVITIGIIMLLF